MDLLHKNRVAVVTGAGNGIGRAEALALASQGALVVVNDIGASVDGKITSHIPADKTVDEIRRMGGIAVANYDSVASESGAENIIASAIENFGRIDILVNNAGITTYKTVDELTTEAWDSVIQTNLYGTFYCTRRACSWMKKQQYGRILNTSSHVGLGMNGLAAYSAAKEGIVGFSRTVARDMAAFGITCNVIRPIAAWRGNSKADPRIDVNRPEDVAVLASFLVSQPADHINACVFEVWRGHIGIYTDPPTVSQILCKEGEWSIDELCRAIPVTLTRGRTREDLPFNLPFKPGD